MVLRSVWLRTLGSGAAVYAVVTVAAVSTGNIHLVPLVLVLGALLLPVTFVIYLFERLAVRPDVLPALAICFAAGGSVGVAAAAILEYQTLRDLGTLPMLAVGLIEESVKVAFPVWLLMRGRFRDPRDGLVLGVASGMGFAALETMGYGLVALIQSQGQIAPAEEVLLERGLLSPVGHAAWTALVCAMLWRRPFSWPAAVAAFATAVLLHAAWDSTDSIAFRLLIGTLSGALLLTQIRLTRAVRSVDRSDDPGRRLRWVPANDGRRSARARW